MNAGIQGLAADIFKVALVRIDRALTRASLDQPPDPAGPRRGHPRGARPSQRDQVASLTEEVLVGAAELRVPLEVDLAFGPSWAEAKG